MATFFISDLHLDNERPAFIDLFCSLMSQWAKEADAIYILGDLFEYWLGDDDLTSFSKQIIAAIKNVSEQNIPVYFMHGNRDFLIGKPFADMTGCKILDDPTLITLQDKRILLMHGDSLCTDDKRYQAFRKKVRSPNNQRYFLALPLWIRRMIASLLRVLSRQQNSNKPSAIMDVSQTTVENIMKQYEADILIHGHTHRGNVHEFDIQGQSVKRFVLDAWHEHGNVLVFTHNSELRSEIIPCKK